MLRRLAIHLQRPPVGKIPSARSALRNSKSFKARQRKIAVLGEEALRQEQEFLGPGGILGDANAPPKLHRTPKSKRARQNEYSVKQGKDIAEQAKSMTDGEWEAVPLTQKHAFTKYVSKVLKENPTTVTEQQRRRYFETTLVDPRDLNPHKTVRDTYERIKMGLPVMLKDPQRQLGVSQAMYEAADANMFDPNNAHLIENAMTHVKQVFVDYVRKKKQGVSTEAERRQLATLTTELNHQTQQHLASMFKYADAKLLGMARSEREKQLVHMQTIADVLHGKLPKSALPTKKQRIKALVRDAYGLDTGVAATILKNLRAQEEFLELCEVMLRMTLGTGFHHSKEDESLDTYIANLRNLYAVDPERFATVDMVRFMAAKEHAQPLDWAKRWYEKALLVPLQETEEYKALRRVQEEEERRAALMVAAQRGGKAVAVVNPDTTTSSSSTNDGDADSPTPAGGGANQGEGTEEGPPPHDALVATHVASIAAKQQDQVIQLADKMFLHPDDRRLASVHEKRLRYLAFMQLESQIQRAREHAKRFEGVELLPEAEQCRELYKALQARKEALGALTTTTSSNASTTSGSGEQSQQQQDGVQQPCPANSFEDPEMQRLFGEIQRIVKATIRSLSRKNAADRRAEQLTRLLRILKGGPDGDGSGNNEVAETPAEQAARLLEERKRAVMNKILGMVEKDVKEDVAWIDNLAESERPPLLPVPEPMSYVSAQDITAWREVRQDFEKDAGNPFKKKKAFNATLLGMPWNIPDKPVLFWGTGITALQQGLRHAAEDAEKRRDGAPLAPPYPCPENPWGWQLVRDVLDD